MAGPGAATQDMGAASHSRSCLVLQPVELLRCARQKDVLLRAKLRHSFFLCIQKCVHSQIKIHKHFAG